MTEKERLEAAELDVRREQRSRLLIRNARRLAELMDTRADLRGVSSLADHLDDAVRWSA